MWILLLLACGPSGGPKPEDSGAPSVSPTGTPAGTPGATTPGGAPTGTSTGTPTGTASGTPTGTTSTPPGFAAPPVITHPDPNIGLARVLELELEEAASVVVTLDDGVAPRALAFAEVGTVHRLPLLGLAPATTYSVGVATDPPGPEAMLALVTEPIPDDFPRFEVLTHDPTRAEPGWTLMPPKGGDLGYIIALDEDLAPAWWFKAYSGVTDVRLGPDGALWCTEGGSVARISPWDGRTTVWGELSEDPDAIPVDALSLHHSVVPEADGSFWVLTFTSFDAPDHPQSYDPFAPLGPETIADVEVAHVLPDGTIDERIGLADVLDRRRLAWDALDAQRDFGVDWCHGNSLEVDRASRTALVGMRHQDAVIELDLDTGEAKWILANHTGWVRSLQEKLLEPRGDLVWPYHMHAPSWMSDGTILMFDNHNVANTPYDGPLEPGTVSRVVRYEVDPERMSVREVWSYWETPTGPLIADTMGDADELPVTGHILATFGNLRGEGDVPNEDRGWGDASARILEIDPDAPDPPVTDLRVYSERSELRRGWNVYRAERIDGFYPAGMLR